MLTVLLYTIVGYLCFGVALTIFFNLVGDHKLPALPKPDFTPSSQTYAQHLQELKDIEDRDQMNYLMSKWRSIDQ